MVKELSFIFQPKTYRCIKGEAIMNGERVPVFCAHHNVPLQIHRRRTDNVIEKICPYGDTQYEEIFFRLNAKIK